MLALALMAVLAASEKPVVSVLYFENQSSDAELGFVSKGLTDMLITDLVAFDGVKVVERTRLEEVLKELNFQQTKYVDKKSATKLGQVLNANYLVYGSITPAGGKLLLETRLVNAKDGAIVASARQQDERDKVFDMEQRLANELVAKIDAKLTADDSARRKVRVKDLATVVAYGKALDLSDQGKLDEAQAVIREVVSKSPTFLLARERRDELLKRFEEYQQRKRDLISDSAVELGKLLDAAMKDEGRVASMSKEQQENFLTLRLVRGRFLARVAKQFLSSRGGATRVMKPGDEAKVVAVLRDWVANQRAYIKESDRARLQFANVYNGITYPASLNQKLSPEALRRVNDSRFGEVVLHDHGFEDLFRFMFEGRLDDGESFNVAPALGYVDVKEGAAVRAELDARIKKELDANDARDASRFIDMKSDLQAWEGDLDGAVTTLQAFLDQFPTDSSASGFERRVKELLEADSNEFEDANRWKKALDGCDDMDIRKGSGLDDRYLRRAGLKGLDDMAAEFEKHCKPERRNQSAFAYFYNTLALDSARAEDCERYRAYTRKYLENDGSVSDMQGYNKNYVPWCQLGDVQKELVWFHATLDRNWTLEFDRHLVSQKSNDGTVFFISASRERDDEQFDLRMEKGKDGQFTCLHARWRRDGVYLEGTCTVTVRKWANDDGVGFDEGTFEAHFTKERVDVTRGSFRARRN